MNESLTKRDLDQLAQRGIPAFEAQRQLRLLTSARVWLRLDRECTRGDGIQRIPAEESDTLAYLHQQASRAGRWMKFVPASGAASRMFAFRDHAERDRLCEQLTFLAFHDELQTCCQRNRDDLSVLRARGAHDEIISYLLDAHGLRYSEHPKGLLTFHEYRQSNRTAFEEHLREAAECFRGDDGSCRVHFTVAEDHQTRFRQLLDALEPVIADQCASKVAASFSVQKPSTDMLALDGDRPLRNDDGQLMLRPGGHGALLENLNDLQADLVFVKNIDNIAHERLRGPGRTWIRAIGGYLIRLQQQVHAHLRALEASSADDIIANAAEFVRASFPSQGVESGASGRANDRHVQLIEILNRPLRVCGMVPNADEPGGGPFWVTESKSPPRPQIVEKSEVNMDDPAQAGILGRATHFNPVFMALAVSDHHGHPFRLQDYSDANRVIRTDKAHAEKTIQVLERPGLWNGSMARWNSVFIEVPLDAFSPVKTVFDLLRDEHQPSDLRTPHARELSGDRET